MEFSTQHSSRLAGLVISSIAKLLLTRVFCFEFNPVLNCYLLCRGFWTRNNASTPLVGG